MDWVQVILGLSLMIIVHEYGHYLCARIGGMHVDRFSVIGIGPPILRLFEHRGCEFVISAIPFGAYVHIVGMEAEDIEEEDDDGPKPVLPAGFRNFRDSPIWARFLAIFGGPAANYLAAIVMIMAVAGSVGIPTRHVVIESFGEGSAAQQAGLEVGDALVSIAGENVGGTRPHSMVSTASAASRGKTVDVVFRRGTQEMSEKVALASEGPGLGITMHKEVALFYTEVPPGEAVTYGLSKPFLDSANQLKTLGLMIKGEVQGKLSGPVGILQFMRRSVKEGFASFVMTTALISTMLGLFNLLPLPALDGGRLVFMTFELIARRRFNPQVEEKVHVAGMLALLGLILYVTVFNDLGVGGDDEAKAQDKTSQTAPAEGESKSE